MSVIFFCFMILVTSVIVAVYSFFHNYKNSQFYISKKKEYYNKILIPLFQDTDFINNKKIIELFISNKKILLNAATRQESVQIKENDVVQYKIDDKITKLELHKSLKDYSNTLYIFESGIYDRKEIRALAFFFKKEEYSNDDDFVFSVRILYPNGSTFKTPLGNGVVAQFSFSEESTYKAVGALNTIICLYKTTKNTGYTKIDELKITNEHLQDFEYEIPVHISFSKKLHIY